MAIYGKIDGFGQNLRIQNNLHLPLLTKAFVNQHYLQRSFYLNLEPRGFPGFEKPAKMDCETYQPLVCPLE